VSGYFLFMIVSFKHKGLEKFYRTGSKAGIIPNHVKRIKAILARLDVSTVPDDMDLPGLFLHKLSGDLAGFYAVTVSGNWRIIFKFIDGNVHVVDYLDYH
jgi:proteic killer suppression protein